MRFVCLVLMLLGFLSSSAEPVNLEVKVCGVDGNPVCGAKIRIYAHESSSVPYKRRAQKKIDFTTDKDGVASKSFSCSDGYITCCVEADGFYPETVKDIFFKSNYDSKLKRVVFSESRKEVVVRLKPRVNPIPMHSYIGDFRWRNFSTNDWGECGYDLKRHDWLPPVGKGENADFYVSQRCINSDGKVSCEGLIRFGGDDGAYIVDCLSNAVCDIVRAADPRGNYISKLSGKRQRTPDGRIVNEMPVLSANQCMIMRTRVIKDDNGNIISCNYSKIYGPFIAAEAFKFRQSSFNPRVNDFNLEFDVNRNLSNSACFGFLP